MDIVEVKAYQQKVNAQLHEAKALLDGVEAHAKGKLAQSQIDAISRLKTKHQEIEKKVQHDLKTTGEVSVGAKVKSDIDAEIAKFKDSITQLAVKAKNQSTA